MKRHLGALALLLAIHLVVTLARGATEAVPAREPLLRADGGPIEALVVQFHRPAAARFLAVYEQLFAALRPETRVIVVVADEEDERLFESARRGWAAGPRIEYVRTGRPITSWARDRFAVLEGREGPVILAPPRPQEGVEARVHDWLVPWAVGRHFGAPVRTARFRFDGGDLIADEARAYVATPLFERNPRHDPRRLTVELEDTLDREVVRIGGDDLPVPDHHIGMFLTPLGGGRVAYADPDLGLAAIGAREGEERTLVVDGAPLALDLSRERLQRFRNVRVSLERAGLSPVPLPILPAREPYVFLGYDNVVLERRADGLHVVLPTYGVEPLDRAAVEAWRALGATVHPVRSEGIVRYGGTIRCLVAPLARSAAPARPAALD